ncbi:MMPL family transporter [Halovivax sp.]|uniref:MMPL family transporter n=1 Tax=Halovivax sp. TaxID=1935978 RepID=UPI0025C06DE3|nr:MMPL family transporter [Halovivax sp.]
MSLPDRIADVITTRSKTVLVVLLLLTVLVGSGMTMVDEETSLDQFESDSPEVEAAEYIDENFTVEDTENQTTVQVIVRDDNVLSRESILDSLAFQQEVRANETVNATLVDDDPINGVENALAITHVQQERAGELEASTAELEGALDETRELQREYESLNASYEAGEVSDEEYAQRAGEIEAGLDEIRGEATEGLDDEQAGVFLDAMEQVREIESEFVALELAYEAGEISEAEYEASQEELGDALEGAYQQGTSGVYADEFAELEDGETPSLDEQIEAIEGLKEDEYDELVRDVLSGDDDGVLRLMPSAYEPGTADAETRMTAFTQSTEDGGMDDMGGVEGDAFDAQLDLQELANGQDQDLIVFGFGIISDEIDRSMADSLAIVGPLALLFVVGALLIAYRDLLDIVLGVAGIFLVLIWTFGFMGWTGIAFNQMFVAVPVLLIGLSIDYAIHVFMRHREQREALRASITRTGTDAAREQREADGKTDDIRGSMRIALAGVGVALVWVTATAAIGFLANLVSPIAPIREFGIVSAFGILAALIVFGGLIPAAKVELDSALESAGLDRRKRAFGTGGGRFSDALSIGATAARRAPIVLLVAVVLVTAAGVYGAANVDTSFEEEDFLAESPPEWTQNLPEIIRPGEYQAKANIEFVNEHFAREDSQAQLLMRGDVADDDALEEIASAEERLADGDVVYTLPTGEADVRSPLSMMQEVADEDHEAYNESFAASFEAADETGNDVPDRDVEALYDELFEVHPAASELLYRTDVGEYEAARLVVAIEGGASFGDTTDEMRDGASDLETAGDGRWEAIATGDPIVSYVVEQDLFETVIQSLLITLVVVFGFLSIAYRLTGNSAALGTVTLLPVAFATSWILGSMYLMGMPFNVLTGMITSLTIGLGVAYSIHISSRYTLELDRQGNVWDAMETTVTGTGGALLGSAATTIGGFGTLSLAILPVLRQFGIITGLTIFYAFLASVVVLPSLLVLWTRYFGPTGVSFAWSSDRTEAVDEPGASEPDPTGGDDD